MDSITHHNNQICTPPSLGESLAHPDHQNVSTHMLTFAHHSQASSVCKRFQTLNHLAMQTMWKQEIALLTKADPFPINRELLNPRELLAHDRKERIKANLKNRMLAVVPKTDTTSLEADVIGCYKKLLKAQRDTVHESTIQFQMDAFEVVQQRYGSSFSFERFIDNEKVIDNTKLEMDKDLELAWPRITQAFNLALPGPHPKAAKIKEWLSDPSNQAVLNTPNIHLYCSGVGLRTIIPEQIGLLQGISMLVLAGNHFTRLPTTLSHLNHLRTLHLFSCDLTHVPAGIGTLANLQNLYLFINQLRDLPSELGHLNSLQTLDLGSNQFTHVPSVIGTLTNLRSLYLNKNQLRDLPSELGHLSHLQTLHLNNNQFTHVPSVIGTLTNLQFLHLNENQLRNLPSELGHLSHLIFLFLNNNQFTCIPNAVSVLPRLITLDLSHNQIVELHDFHTDHFRVEMMVNVADNPIRSIHGFVEGNIQGVNIDLVEEWHLPFHEWFESHFTLSSLDALSAFRNKMAGFIVRFIESTIDFVNQISSRGSVINRGLMTSVGIVWCFLIIPILVFNLMLLMPNSAIWIINTFITGVIGPVVSFFRELLGYPATVRMRLR